MQSRAGTGPDVPFLEALESRTLLAAPALGFAFNTHGVEVASMATDRAGNFYLAGEFSGTADFDFTSGVYSLTGPQFSKFVAKYRADGSPIWVRQFTGYFSATQRGMAVDAQGNVIVGGEFEQTVDFDPSPAVHALTAHSGYTDGFILKLDRDGNYLFANRITFSHVKPSYVYDLATDSKGNIIAGGVYFGAPSSDPSRTFVVKFSAAGRSQWIAQYGDDQPGNSAGLESMAIDSHDRVHLAITQLGQIDYDPGAASGTITGYTSVLATVGSDGRLVSTAFFGTQHLGVSGIAIDSADRVIVHGAFEGRVDVNLKRSATYLLRSNGATDGFVAQYSSDGTLAWAHAIGSTNEDSLGYLSVDAHDQIYASASFQGQADFDPTRGTLMLDSRNGGEVLARYTPRGDLIGLQQLTEGPSRMVISAAGPLYMLGPLTGKVDFDPSPGEFFLEGVLGDVFLVKLI